MHAEIFLKSLALANINGETHVNQVFISFPVQSTDYLSSRYLEQLGTTAKTGEEWSLRHLTG